jgi:uroporphyrinogen decarboxylase
MNKLERVRAALAGASVDRPPYSFWTHLPGIDLDPMRLADATAAFAARYDVDFVKSMPNGLYVVEDWGAETDYSDIERGGVARVVRPAVATPDDWRRLADVDVAQGAFGRELTHLARLTRAMGDIPVLATVFSPLTIASKLSSQQHRIHLAAAPEQLAAGLAIITRVTCAFARAAIASGCAGVFFAVQDAVKGVVDAEAYRRYGEPYDRRVLAAAREAGSWFDVVHMHGEHVLFDLLAQYPVDALNWHIGETPPAIADYRKSGGTRPILGGMQRGHITRGDRDAVRADIDRAMRESDGRALLLAPACVIRHPVDDAVLKETAAYIERLA